MIWINAEAPSCRQKLNLARLARGAFLGAALAAILPAAQAQTNVMQLSLDYWARELNLNLTATTNGPTTTNGIIARLTAPGTRVNAQSLLRAINGNTVLAISKALTNYTIVAHHVTNQYTVAYPVFSPVTFSNTPAAKIFVLTPLGYENYAPIVAVCPDPHLPQALYSIDAYVQILTAAFDGRSSGATLTSGQVDIAHDLAATSTTSIREFVFNGNTFADSPPTGNYFDVQGFTTEQQHDLVENGVVVNGSVPRSAVSSVAGTGQIGGPGTFTILHGTISFSNGKRESQ